MYIKTQDPDAFRSLVERHHNMVYATCHRILDNSADAEDATQNCFIRLAQNANTIKTSPAGWLHQVATNASIDLLRKKRTQLQREVSAMQERQQDSNVDWKNLRPILDEAVAVLPDRLRIPLILHYLEGRKQADIASELGINQSAVSKRLKSGIEALRKRLVKMGLVASSATLASLIAANSAEAAPAALSATLAGLALSKGSVAVGAAAAGSTTAVGTIVLKAVVGVVVATGLVAGGLAVKKATVADNKPQAEKAQIAPVVEEQKNPEEPEEVLSTVISGRVINEQNEGIKGTRVIIWYHPRPWDWGHSVDWRDHVLGETSTDEEGRYELTINRTVRQVCTTVVCASFIAKGYGVHEESLGWFHPLAPALRRPDVKLGPSGTFKGRVIDYSGKPVPGVSVLVGPNTSPHRAWQFDIMWTVLSSPTDKDGNFIIDGINPGSRLVVEVRGPEGQTLYRYFNFILRDSINIRIPELGSIDGYVVSAATGQPVGGTAVKCRPVRQQISAAAASVLHTYNTEADDNGHFHIDNIFPWHYEVVATGSKLYGIDSDIRVHPAEQVSCKIEVKEAHDITVSVSFRENGAPAPFVPLLSGNTLGASVLRIADKAGVVNLCGLPPKKFQFRTFLSGWMSHDIDLHADVPQKDLNIKLLGNGFDSLLRGTVRDKNGQPASGAWVAIRRGIWDPYKFSVADEQGRYELRLLSEVPEPGNPLPVLALSHDMTSYGVGQIGSNWHTGEEVNISMYSPLTSIKGKVTDTDGRHLAGARICTRGGLGKDPVGQPPISYLWASTRSDDDGRFVLSPVDADLEWSIEATASGYAVEWPKLQPGQDQLEIRMKPANSSISGRVFDENNQPLAGILIGGMFQRVISDADGMYHLGGLHDGQEGYSAVGIDYGPVFLEGVKAPAENAEIHFLGRATEKISGRVLDSDGLPAKKAHVIIRGDQTYVNFRCDREGCFSAIRCVPGKHFITASSRGRTVLMWDIPAGTKDLTIRLPSEGDLELLKEDADLRKDLALMTEARIPLAEFAIPRRVDWPSLPTRDRYWMIRSSYGWFDLTFEIPETGTYRLNVRARRVWRNKAPELTVRTAKTDPPSVLKLQLTDYEWREYSGNLDLEAGEVDLRFLIDSVSGAADLEWVELRPVESQ